MRLGKATTVGDIETKYLYLAYQNVRIMIHYRLRRGKRDTLLFLHGLGCSMDDFLLAYEIASLNEHTIVSFDFPGCGRSPYVENSSLDIDDLVSLTTLVVSQIALEDVVLIGHSMGGLVALLFCERNPGSVRALVNVEGNLASDDCFFSRKAAGTDYTPFKESLFPEFVRGLNMRENRGFREYARILENHTNPRAFYDYCPSLVSYSDSGMLLDKMLTLGLPALYLYGSENRNIPSVRELKRRGVQLVEIEGSNHFPQYDNPDLFYEKISGFVHMLG